MVAQAETTHTRTPLSRERVLEAAIDYADEHGIDALSMRKLGNELGVEAMSLYNHVKNKTDLFVGMVDLLVEGIDLVDLDGDDWQATMRAQLVAARDQMLAHKWAPSVMETLTTISQPVLRYSNQLVGIFVQGGFSYDLTHHALHALGSRAFGFSQELFEPDDPEQGQEDAERVFAEIAHELPYLVGMLGEIVHDDGPDDTIGWCDDQTEFFFALDLILDGLERLRLAEAAQA